MDVMDETPTPDHRPAPSTPPDAPAPQRSADPRARRRTGLIVGGATALALGVGAAGLGLTVVSGGILQHLIAPSSQTTVEPGIYRGGNGTDGSGTDGSSGGSSRRDPFGGYGFGQGSGSSSSATAASADQKKGVVTIVSELGYSGQSEAAGTGIILTSSGRILTNNHVVEGSTKISVTVESTDQTYTATVVGTDATNDVAVLQLTNADGSKVTGLTVAKIDDDGLQVGDAVTDVGNAGGTGDLVVASGTVSALQQTIQVADESTGAAKSLSGLVELDADIQSGDSGGPVLDAEGEVAGIATAASTGSRDVTGYAIPIDTAMAIVDRIAAGDESGTIMIGLPPFLGVELATNQQAAGATIAGVIEGMPAEQSGLAAGSVITAVDGTAVGSTSDLQAAIASHQVGDQVTITWTDTSGAAHQAAVTLIAGPAA